MAFIITTILGLTVGFLWNKARDYLENERRNGDLADEKLREVFARDLNDIKFKIDSMLLKDGTCSLSFLKEGVRLLRCALDNLSEGQEAKDSPSEVTRVSTDSACRIFNEVLALKEEVQKMNLSSESKMSFDLAKDCFKAARERATDALSIKSLSIKDQIMACKLREAARVLECGFEQPEAAFSACLEPLEDLMGRLPVQEMFSVFFQEGLKSKVFKPERLENIMSVLFINHFLFDLSAKYSTKYPDVFDWPTIKFAPGRTFHPISHTCNIVVRPSGSERLVQQLNRMIKVDKRMYDSYYSAVNSRNEVILLGDRGDKITVFNSKGERNVAVPDASDSKVIEQCREAIAVDSNDNVFVVRSLKPRHGNNSNKEKQQLCVLDSSYNIRQGITSLDFLDQRQYKYVEIAVDENNLIMITDLPDKQVYVCDKTGKFLFKFLRDGNDMRRLSITDKKNILIPSADGTAINVYTSVGKEVEPTVKVPDGHQVWRVAFHHRLLKIFVLTYAPGETQYSWSLLRFSKIGFLEETVPWCEGDWDSRWEKEMTSLPGGPVFVSSKESITFI